MHWSDAGSRLALILRRLRGRFGIAAPRVAVRTHIPWYWRGFAIVAMTSVALALAGWIYDAGRRFAGFDRDETLQELIALRGRIAELETERAELRKVANASESSLQIERTTQQQLSQQVRVLGEENARLREDLAAFENLAQGEGKQTAIALSRLRVEEGAVKGQYRFHLLAALRGGQKSQEFNGMLRLRVALLQEQKNVIIEYPSANDPSSASYQVSIKHFRKIEGGFKVPEGAQVRSVEVRLVQGGIVRATQTVAF